MSFAIKSHRHEHSFFLKGAPCFLWGFFYFFNTLCGEMMPRIEWMYWYSTVRHLLNPSPIFSDVRDEAPSTMRETKERSPNDNWEWQLFVLLISLAMRFVVLYTWFKEKCPQSSLIVKKWTTYTIWVAFGFTFIGNPEEINPSFQLQQLMRRHQFFLRGCRRGAVFFSSAASQRSHRPGDASSPSSSSSSSLSSSRPWLLHPWLPQDDRLSYRESLRDSGVSRTWGRLGDRASSGRSLSSSSPASRLISGTLGVRVFPRRLMPDWAGTGRLPGSTTRLEEGPLAFVLWKEAEGWETFKVMCCRLM